MAEVFKQERVTEECKQQMIAQDETKTKIQNFKAIDKRLFLLPGCDSICTPGHRQKCVLRLPMQIRGTELEFNDLYIKYFDNGKDTSHASSALYNLVCRLWRSRNRI